MNFPGFPRAVSNHGQNIDSLFLILSGLSIFFTVLVVVMMLTFIIKYRRRSPDEIPVQTTGSTRLELSGMAVLGVLAFGTFLYSAQMYVRIYTPPRDALTVFVVGQQWMWKIQHPTGQREINTLHVPVNQPVKLILTSQDVIHSFFVPAFRIKQDAVPGRYTEIWFEATDTGTYHLFCAEYCGTNHAMMIGEVTVQTPADYEAWLAGGPSLSPADAGQRLFQDLSCASCHREDSQARAPSLTGIFGQPVPLQDGSTVIADENYIRESILNPGAHIHQGFQPIMPSYQGRLSEEQIFELIAYIRSLGAGTGQSPGEAAPDATAEAPLAGTPAASPEAAEETPASSDDGAGAEVFQSLGCSGCHAADDSGVGPSLAGIFGTEIPLEGGGTATVDEDYLRDSILDPSAQVHEGYPPVMPSYEGRINDTQMAELIEYISSLQPQ